MQHHYGIKEGERCLLEIWVKLGRGEFSWSDYVKKQDVAIVRVEETVEYWINEYRKSWEKKRALHILEMIEKMSARLDS